MRPSYEDSINFLSNFKATLGGFNDLDYRNFEYLLLQFCKNPLSVLEIGSWTGTSACLLAYYARQFSGKLWCIDTFNGGSNLKNEEVISVKDILKMHLINYSLYKHTEIIEGDSSILQNRFNDNFFGIIFIDANHDSCYVKNDIANSLPKLKPQGVLIGHDYHHSSVGETVSCYLPSRKVLNNFWYYVKEN